MILLAIAATIAIPAIVIDLVFIALLTGFMFVTNILLKIIKIKAKDILSMILLLVFIGMLVIVALAVSKLSEIGSKIDWIGVLNIMGAILVTAVLAIGIGYLAMIASPIMGPAILGLLALAVLIGVLTLTGWLLSVFQKLDLNEDKIKENIGIIMNSIKLIINSIFGKDETGKEKSDKSWFSKLIDIVAGPFKALKSIAEALLTVPYLLSALISIGCLFLLANLLQKIGEIEISSNIEAKVKQIISTAGMVTRAVNQRNAKEDNGKKKGWFSRIWQWLGQKFRNIADILNNIKSAAYLITVLPSIAMLRTIVDVLNSINDFKINGDIAAKTQAIIQTAKTVTDAINGGEGGIDLDFNKTRRFKKFVDHSITYIEGINKLDINKVRTLSDMYEKMGEFMDKIKDVPLDKIAEVLEDQISPALSDISDSMVSINKSKENNQNSNSAQTRSSSTSTSNITNVNGTGKQIDYTGMLENIEDLLEQIKKKLNSQPQPAF